MGREIIKQGSNMLLLDLKNRLKLNILITQRVSICKTVIKMLISWFLPRVIMTFVSTFQVFRDL